MSFKAMGQVETTHQEDGKRRSDVGTGFRWVGGGGGARRKSRQGGDCCRGCSLMRQKTEPRLCKVEVTAYLAWGWGAGGRGAWPARILGIKGREMEWQLEIL